MSHDTLSPQEYFDIAGLSFADIFKRSEFVWNALKDLDDYLNESFKSGTVVGNYQDRHDVYVGEGTVIDEGVKIIGPAIIGNNCHITHAAYLRGECLIGDNVVVGHAVELKHSILLSDCAIAHLNYVGDSIVGRHVNVAGGAMCANYRLDKQPVRVKKDGEYVDTGLIKFGSIIGDGASIGANVVLNPGTIIAKNTVIYPLMAVRGMVQGTVRPQA